MPLAYSHIRVPWLLKWAFRKAGSDRARSPMVRTPRLLSFEALRPPTMKSSDTGRGHIFASISSGYRVWTFPGFSKSLAIFASTLTVEIPTFTVNPKRAKIRSRMRPAASSGEA